MLVLGLAGPAGAGKDTVADYLVRTFGFVKFAFSDALYAEVQAAYGLPDQTLLRDRETKEVPSQQFALEHCRNLEFEKLAARNICTSALLPEYVEMPHRAPLSPRWILQQWGTQFRRAQNDYYWLNRAHDFIDRIRDTRYPEHAPQYFVETGTRFENERKWICSQGQQAPWEGTIWHIHRDSLVTQDAHESARSLPVLANERELWNNDSIDRLYGGIDLLMTTQARFVRVEPMDPIVALKADGVTLAGKDE